MGLSYESTLDFHDSIHGYPIFFLFITLESKVNVFGDKIALLSRICLNLKLDVLV